MTAAVVGLDLSLTATGIVDSCGCDDILTSKNKGMDRLEDFRMLIWERISRHDDLVVIEGYSMGTARQSSHAHGLGELGGIIRHMLWRRGIMYVDVAPASLKKFATGKGNASKEEVTGAAIRAGCPSNNNNVCDAFWLRNMGLMHYDQATVPRTQYRDDAMTGVVWPEAA